ncbi:MAG: DUF3280 domain-containing protein [Rhodospirillales bacterium]|jgi:hypothetical protein|nr:DUF3280 domain-containing protein [Rhodospirillales bacterium]
MPRLAPLAALLRTTLAAVVVVSAFLAAGAVSATAAPRLAVLEFRLINTSPLPDTAAEKARLVSLTRQLQSALATSGRYRLLDPAQVEAAQKNEPGAADCGSCAAALARKLGAGLVAMDYVQKVSDLILNINVIIEDARTGKMVGGGSADIRGNTDLSWQRGLAFLLSNYGLVGG